MIDPVDWTYLQSFIAVTRHGSLSAAGKALGASQPTMGRHVSALEDKLGLKLFERTATGLVLTDSGLEILQYAEQMGGIADQLALVASGRSQAIAGTIRITASDVMATYILPKILTALHLAEPEIEIELIASDRTENLLQREADIAVRMYRPTQADIYARKVGELAIGMFAAHDYIDRRGLPSTVEDFLHHDVIGYDRSDQIIHGMRAAGLTVDRHFFPMRCDNQIVCWQMVVAGFGIGFNQLNLGAAEPRVRQILVDTQLPALPIWLTAHSELKTSLRQRRVFDFLAQHLKML